MVVATSPTNLGLNDADFAGGLNSIPYAQFINPSGPDSEVWGIGIKKGSADLAGFKPDENWQLISHQFGESAYSEELYISSTPRVIVLNQGKLLMQSKNGGKYFEFDPDLREKGGFEKVFSYVVIWFVGENNEPLSDKPFRLRCSGKPGGSFRQNFYSGNPKCFAKMFLNLYQDLSEDKTPKNWLFFAHTIYQPKIEIEEITLQNKSKVYVATTKSFVEPSLDNFVDIAIANGCDLSMKIREAMATSESWLPVADVSSADLTSMAINGQKTQGQPVGMSTPNPF